MPKKIISKKIFRKLREIKILLTDVDGVLTDGGMYYTAEGLVMKKFNAKDGMGANLLRENGVKIGIISADKTPIAKKRAEVLKFDYIYFGITKKIEALAEIIKISGVQSSEIAFIGDDVNDLEVFENVGLSIAPSDAASKVLQKADLITPIGGGKGAYRYIADLIIESQSESK